MSSKAVEALLERMQVDLARLVAAEDARRFFHATYLRTTEAIVQEIDAGGFDDASWVESWDLAFAARYLDALDADLHAQPVPGPWRVAFEVASRQPRLPPLQHVLFGLNAHINYDLPQALVHVISSADFDDADLLSRREADHRHVDAVLQARVGAEETELGAVAQVTLDRILRPANRAASRRFLAEARAKVWRNTFALDGARRRGPVEYTSVVTELEGLCARRVSDLTGSARSSSSWHVEDSAYWSTAPEDRDAAGTRNPSP